MTSHQSAQCRETNDTISKWLLLCMSPLESYLPEWGVVSPCPPLHSIPPSPVICATNSMSFSRSAFSLIIIFISTSDTHTVNHSALTPWPDYNYSELSSFLLLLLSCFVWIVPNVKSPVTCQSQVFQMKTTNYHIWPLDAVVYLWFSSVTAWSTVGVQFRERDQVFSKTIKIWPLTSN